MSKILDVNKPNTIIEHYIGVDEFNHPKVYTDEDATYTLLCRLILLEPGTYPTHPTMGVGLVSKYRYGDSSVLSKLQDEIKSQIEQFLPQFINVGVDLGLTTKKELYIYISIGKMAYNLIYDKDKHTLDTLNQ